MIQVQSVVDLMTVTGVTIGDRVRVLDNNLVYVWVSGDQANLNNWAIQIGSTGYKYEGGMPLAVGYAMQSNRPLDERDVVETRADLATVPNCYAGIVCKIADEEYKQYLWNGIDQTNLANWILITDAIGLYVNVTGADTVENIKAIVDPINGEVWVATDSGTDSYGDPVAQYDGMVFEGSGWIGIGPLQGPQGVQGAAGTAATVNAGTTTTLSAGTDANVINVGNITAAIFDFYIPQGAQGIQGETGASGNTITVKGSDTYDNIILKDGTVGDLWISTTADIPAGVEIGDGLISNGEGAGAANWSNIGALQGPQGEQGVSGHSATIDAGTTTTLSATSDATVTNVGTTQDAIFDFGIPEGIQGIQGETGNSGFTPTVSAGTTTTLSAGTPAYVTTVGTIEDVILDFGIPEGPVGPQGIQGETGDNGTGVASGGTQGQILIKDSAGDYDTSWANSDSLLPSGGTEDQVLTKVDNADYNVEWADSQATSEYNELEFIANNVPIEVLADSMKMYAYSAGTTTTLYVINEALEQIIVSTYKS